MRNFVKSFLRDDSGASAAEYALILGIVGVGIAVAAFALGGEINTAINKAEDCIETANNYDGTGDAPTACATTAG